MLQSVRGLGFHLCAKVFFRLLSTFGNSGVDIALYLDTLYRALFYCALN